MIVFRPNTSFPYLALARELEIDYAMVLKVSDLIRKRYLQGEPIMANLATFVGLDLEATEAIYRTTHNEHTRREMA